MLLPSVLAGVFQDDQFVYFVLEYVVGGELYMYTSEVGKLGDPDARFYTSQIVEALSYMVQLHQDMPPLHFATCCALCSAVLCSLLSALCSAWCAPNLRAVEFSCADGLHDIIIIDD